MAESDFVYPWFDVGQEILYETDFLEQDFSKEEIDEIDQIVSSSLLGEKEKTAMEKSLESNYERTAGGRFKTLNSMQLEELETMRQSKSTKRNTQWGLKIFIGKQNSNFTLHYQILNTDTNQ